MSVSSILIKFFGMIGSKLGRLVSDFGPASSTRHLEPPIRAAVQTAAAVGNTSTVNVYAQPHHSEEEIAAITNRKLGEAIR